MRRFGVWAAIALVAVTNAVVLAGVAYNRSDTSEALVVMTDWLDYRRPDFPRMRELMKAPVVFDARNLYEAARLRDLDFTYYPLGRAAVT